MFSAPLKKLFQLTKHKNKKIIIKIKKINVLLEQLRQNKPCLTL